MKAFTDNDAILKKYGVYRTPLECAYITFGNIHSDLSLPITIKEWSSVFLKPEWKVLKVNSLDARLLWTELDGKARGKIDYKTFEEKLFLVYPEARELEQKARKTQKLLEGKIKVSAQTKLRVLLSLLSPLQVFSFLGSKNHPPRGSGGTQKRNTQEIRTFFPNFGFTTFPWRTCAIPLVVTFPLGH